MKKAAAEGISEQQLDDILKEILGAAPSVDSTPKPCGKPSEEFMMFIQMVASDGVITEQEFEVNMKRGDRENLDKDEVAVLLATYQQKTSADVRAQERGMEKATCLNRLLDKLSKPNPTTKKVKRNLRKRGRKKIRKEPIISAIHLLAAFSMQLMMLLLAVILTKE